ncbi:MAG: ABC transporter substrate-binding protein [Casimicrobiaceae bacterium]
MRTKTWQSFLVTLGAIAVLAVAPPAGAAEPKRGGTLTYSYHPEPTALSTIATTAVPVALISTKIFESLLEYEGPGLEPRPGLAESWTVSPDHLTYAFKLRPGVKWHDGKPFTSEDVKFSIEKIVRPLHSRGKVQFGNVSAIQTPDPLTVVFKLAKPVPFFLKTFQPSEAPMFPKHAFVGMDVEDSKAVRASPFMQKPIGTGPFRLKEWKKGEYIILERNPDYWKQGKPYLERIVMRVIPDAAARSIALENGEIDLAPMSAIAAADIQRLGGLKNIEVNTQGNEGLGPNLWLELNLREKPLSDVRVRQAISAALNRDKIVDVIWFGQGKPAVGPLVSGNPYFNKSIKPYDYNPKRANELLDQAGYPRGANGVRFKMTQNTLPYGESWTRMSEYIKQDLSKVGIEVETQNLDLGGWLKKIYTDWDFNITSTFSHNYSDPSIGVQRTFVSSSIQKGATFTNSMGYVNPKLDELFAAALIETDPAQRRKQLNEVQAILHDDLPVIFLMEMAYTHLWNKRVHGLIANGISMYSNWDSVWVE